MREEAGRLTPGVSASSGAVRDHCGFRVQFQLDKPLDARAKMLIQRSKQRMRPHGFSRPVVFSGYAKSAEGFQE